MHFIGLDIGTSSISGVLTNGRTGQIIKSLTIPNLSQLDSSNEWEFIQDPALIITLISEIVKDLSALGLHVSSIGIAGQMHGILYIDDRGNHVSPLFTWQDQRGDLPFAGEGGRTETYAQHLNRLTSYPSATGYGLVTHYYNMLNHLVPENAAKLCTIADYAAMKLSLQSAPVIDPSMAAGLGFFDLEALNFDQTALQLAGIDSHILPPVLGSGTVIGHTEHQIPVVGAIGDNQASFLGAVRDIPSSVLINIGTGSQISVYTDRLIRSEVLDTRPFPGGGYILVGASLSGGNSYALLEGFLREVCSLFAGYDGGSLFDRMNEMANTALQDSFRLKVNSQFYGTRSNPREKGSIERITDKNWTPRHLVLGFLEGIIDELHGFFEQIPDETKRKYITLVGSGNGVRKNSVLRTLVEQAFDFPMQMPKYKEEAAYGAALCAGVGCGFYSNFQTTHFIT
jgi:sedoheptulokinase